MIICIDPGHGGRDNGGGTCRLFKEKDWVLQTSLFQAEIFRQAGYQVVLTRDRDKNLPMKQRTKIIRKSGADICLCNHVNNVTNPAAYGLEAFHSIYANPAAAMAVASEVLSTGFIRPRSGCKTVRTRESKKYPGKDYYDVHHFTGRVPVILLEYGFASNPQDAKSLHEHQVQLADAAARGLMKYLEAIKG